MTFLYPQSKQRTLQDLRAGCYSESSCGDLHMKPGILLMVRELHHGGSERQLRIPDEGDHDSGVKPITIPG